MIIKKVIGLIYNTYLNQIQNFRKSLASTKTKSMVKGGGIKPWKQKGTGKARAGSNRSPLWVGGGVTFGPNKNKNYKIKINFKEKNLARLVLKYEKQKKIIIINKDINLSYIEGYYLNNKTNQINKRIIYQYNIEEIKTIINNLNLNKNEKILIILNKNDYNFNFNNLKNIIKQELNIKLDFLIISKFSFKTLINYKQIIMTQNIFYDIIANDFLKAILTNKIKNY